MTDIKLSPNRIDELIEAVNALLIELVGDRLKSTCVSVMIDRRRNKAGEFEQTSDYVFVIWHDERGQQVLPSCVNSVDRVLDAIRQKIIGPPFAEIAAKSTAAFLALIPDVVECEAVNA